MYNGVLLYLGIFNHLFCILSLTHDPFLSKDVKSARELSQVRIKGPVGCTAFWELFQNAHITAVGALSSQ